MPLDRSLRVFVPKQIIEVVDVCLIHFAAAMQAMVDRGPDIPFVLYTYAIYLASTGREDFVAIQSFADRARAKDPYGQHYLSGWLMSECVRHEINMHLPSQPFVSLSHICPPSAYEGFYRYSLSHNKSFWSSFHFALATMFSTYEYQHAYDHFLNALDQVNSVSANTKYRANQ